MTPAPTAVTDHDQVRRIHGFHPLRVVRVVEETHDTRSYVLDVPDDLRDAFGYRPGQFCTFRVRLGGEEHLRSYSMSSAPETDGDLTVTVKRVPGGVVSNWFNDQVAEGDVLEVTRPAGVFCPRDSRGPVVAFCGGSGVTPVMSIVKSVLATTDRRVELLYANRDRRSVIFDDELRSLHARHPDRFELRHRIDADAGYLRASDIAAFATGSLDGDFYICGPTPFMDLVESTLLDLGVTPDQILIERFITPSASTANGTAATETSGAAATDGTAATSGMAAAGTETTGAQPAAETGGTGTKAGGGEAEVTETVVLILNGKKATVAYRQGDTVLETARRGGLKPPFSCEAGNCATCMALVHEGSATMRANNALTPEEVEEGWILTCQSLPQGRTVTVEYESL